MNYAQARQIDPEADRPDAGKWRWTVRNDNNIRPDGYCSPLELCGACGGETGWLYPGRPSCDACDSRGLIESANPCPGHDTAEEAEEHYREYQIDRAEFVEIVDADAQMLGRCKMCDKHTASYMRIKGDAYRHDLVCPEHHERSTAEFLIQRSAGAVYS